MTNGYHQLGIEISFPSPLCLYIAYPQQVLCRFLPVVTDDNWAPRGPRQNYKGDGKMGLESLGRQIGGEVY
jgi:hypothetical protein